MLRGCGSSVNSTDSGQSFVRQYWICLVISSSVKSGRKEKVPWVMRTSVSSDSRRRRDDVGGVGGLVVERDVAPRGERGVQRTVAGGGLLEDVRTLLEVVAALVTRLDHR